MAVVRKVWWRRLSWRLLQAAIVFVALSVMLVLALRWLPPPSTAFVLARRIDGWTGAAANLPIRRDWVAQPDIAPELFLAVVAAEDQRFPDHHGFDLQAIEQALDDREKGKVRGAS
nr:transglycosylase domain-containing protein [Xanthomonadales bacterium]